MTTQTTNLFDAALALPYDVRLELANRLWLSLKPPGMMSEDDPGFVDEIRRRCEAADVSGGLDLSADEVIEHLRNSLAASKTT